MVSPALVWWRVVSKAKKPTPFPLQSNNVSHCRANEISLWPSVPRSEAIFCMEASQIRCRIDLRFCRNVCEAPINTLCGSLKCLGGEVKYALSALTSLGCALCLASRRAPKICGSGELVAHLGNVDLGWRSHGHGAVGSPIQRDCLGEWWVNSVCASCLYTQRLQEEAWSPTGFVSESWFTQLTSLMTVYMSILLTHCQVLDV